MNIDALLVWGGLIVALLDSTGYGSEINNLIDRIILNTKASIKDRESPILLWHRNFHIWLMVQSLLQGHEMGYRRLPDWFAEEPEVKKYTLPMKKLRSMGEHRLVFRKALNSFFMKSITWVCGVLELVIVAAIWTPFWFVLVHLEMNPINAGVVTLAIAAFFNIIFFNPLFAVAHYISVTIIAIVFAVMIFLAFFPLLAFRIFPIGYLSAAGLLFAALGAFRHLSG